MHLRGVFPVEENPEQQTDYELAPLRPSHPAHFNGDDDLWEHVYDREEAPQVRPRGESENFVNPPTPPTPTPTPADTHTYTSIAVPAPADDFNLLLSNQVTPPNILSKSPTRNSSASHYDNDKPLWTPFWLRKTTLLGFIILFTLLWIALFTLWLFVKRNNGLEISLTSNRYVWRFAPTAVLIIVAGLWRQVDYHCKTSYPWHEMRRGLSKASSSMTLDYISAFQVNAFFKAVKSGHHSVAASVLGFVLLKLALVFSTGLLVSTPTTLIDSSYPLSVRTKLDGKDWAAEALASQQEFLRSATPNSLYAFFGILAAGMADPVGSKDGFAFQTFGLRDNHSAMRRVRSMSADVDVFVPLPICELTNVTIQPTAALHEFSNTTGGGAVHLGIASTTCHLGFSNYTRVYVSMKNPRTQLCEPRELVAELQQVNCTEKAPPRRPSFELFDDENGDVRWLLAVSDIRYSQTFAPSSTQSPNITSWSRDVEHVTAILCKPQYTIMRRNLTYEHRDSAVPPRIHLQPPEERPSIVNLDRITSSVLNEAILQSLKAGAHIFRPINFQPESLPSNDGVNTLFQLMVKSSAGGATLEKFLDGKMMSRAFQSVYSGVASQFAQQNLIVPTSDDSTGKVVYVEDRLHVGIISLWIMFACFVSLSVLSVTILLMGPSAIAPRDPDSIAAQATILVSSNELQGLLQDTGHLSDNGIKDKLRNYTFRTSTYQSFRITARYGLRESVTSMDEHSVEASGFWKPLAARKAILALIYVMPMFAIAALEIMQQLSNRNKGLMTLNTEKWKSLPQYLCALVAVGIATLYNNLDFTVAMLTPFEALRKGNVTAGGSILTHLLGKIPLFALWEAIRGRHIGAVSSTTAAFAASFLTVIVSGLWNLDLTVIISHSVTASRTDAWNMALKNYSSNDGNAGLVFSLLQYHNLSTPPWTWNELVFPKIQIDALNTHFESLGQEEDAAQSPISYTFTLPALRPSLKCSLLTIDDIQLENFYGPGSHSGTYRTTTTASVRPKLPPKCRASLPENLTTTEFSLAYLEVDGSPTDGGYIGSLFDLYLPPRDPKHLVDLWQRPDNPSGCPSIGIIFGYMRANRTSLANLTAALCDQEIQEIPTEVTFSEDANLGLIDPKHPPRYNDTGPLKLLTNGTDGFSSFSFRVQEILRLTLETRSRSTLEAGQPSGPETYDSIFNEIIHGPHGGVPPESLMGAANANKLLDVVNGYYTLYMAQVINLTLRKPISTSDTKQRRQDAADDDDSDDGTTAPALQIFSGTLHRATPRLKSNFGPKLSLQLILASMVILGSLAVFTMRLRGTLPHNPCSIAGTMSLLAGSELCDSGSKLLPPKAEKMEDRQLRNILEGQGLLFGLGWWKWRDERGEYENERFGIDVGRAG
ncbi:hypothetical protein AJ78_08049 [Emergomyces pasteurianus Ep9510]|uniref:Uncharacterized protein n=1 Tax=Emergomyces pasteurianus Ep9510 TaxID=1447872 RepID=A0A1J9PTC1_9EURO|nr:hypothetical protein AJ78_08049 [Emergomyces pasteurianus Ep9510]